MIKTSLILLLLALFCSCSEKNQPNDTDKASLIENIDSSTITRKSEILQQDSIQKEDSLRFLASAIITNIKYNKQAQCYEQNIRKNWQQKLKELGFEKGKKRIEEKNIEWIEGEIFDLYSVPFKRTLNGRAITVKAYYYCYDETHFYFVEDTNNGASFEIIFADTQDEQTFKKSLLELGISQKTTYGNLDNCYQTRPKTKSTYACPDITWRDNSPIITIWHSVDC